MNNFLFSVVIPAYNAENFICETLDSVAAQTINDYEVIIVDDGSTDSTYQKIVLWINDHPLIKASLVKQANKGIGGARNTGIYNSSGKYIAFLDSDDLWLGKKLEFLSNYLKDNPSVDLICHDECLQKKKGKNLLFCGPYKTYQDLLFKGNCFFTSATVARRKKILEIGGFSEDMRFNSVEDYDLWLRLAKSGCEIAYLHEVLGVYRHLGQGITSNFRMHNQNSINLLDKHFQDWQPKTLYYRYLIKRVYARRFRTRGHSYLKHGVHFNAKKYLYKSLKHDLFCWKTWMLLLLNILKIKK